MNLLNVLKLDFWKLYEENKELNAHIERQNSVINAWYKELSEFRAQKETKSTPYDITSGGYLYHPPYSEPDEKETFKPSHPVIRPLRHSMTLTEYQGLAQRTANKQDEIRLATAGLGVAGEAGELAGAIKKHLSHGHDFDKEHIREEIGDVLWYLAEIAAICGMTLEEVALANIEKLQRRYPEGFDPERSKNRGEG